MTFGQMKILTDRFNQIKKVKSPWIRTVRLENMLNDVVLAYADNEGKLRNKHARGMFKSILDEMEVA